MTSSLKRCGVHRWAVTGALDYRHHYILRCAECGKRRSQTKAEFVAYTEVQCDACYEGMNKCTAIEGLEAMPSD